MTAPLCCAPAAAMSDILGEHTAEISIRQFDTAAALTFENDLFFQSDRYYTDGIQLLVKHRNLSEIGQLGRMAAAACAALACAADVPELVRHKFGQLMYTPVRISVAEPQPYDRPWAGMLYYTREYEWVSALRDRRTTISGTVGVIGPGSLAEQTQKRIHRTFSGATPRGWDNQIGGELGLMVLLEERRAVPRLSTSNGNGVQLRTTASLRGALGNIMTFVGLGGSVTVGKDIESTAERDGISVKTVKRPERAVTSAETEPWTPAPRTCLFTWLECSASVSAEVRWMLRNVFLDGRAFGDGPSVDKKRFVADASLGLRLDFPRTRSELTGPWYVAVSATRRTPEFNGRRGSASAQTFGTVTIGTEF